MKFRRLGTVTIDQVPHDYECGDICSPEEDRYLRSAEMGDWDEALAERVRKTPQYEKLPPSGKRVLEHIMRKLITEGQYDPSMAAATRIEYAVEITAGKSYHGARKTAGPALYKSGILRKVCHLRYRLVKPPYSPIVTKEDGHENTSAMTPGVVDALDLITKGYEQLQGIFSEDDISLGMSSPKKAPRRQRDANSKLTHEAIREIRTLETHPDREGAKGWVIGIAKRHKVSANTVYSIWSGQIHAHVP